MITISKNRGWRGLANAVIVNTKTGDTIVNSIFSFSAAMWQDLLKGYLVTHDISTNIYTIWRFNNTEALPKPSQQRSVLINGFAAEIIEQISYPSGNIYKPDIAMVPIGDKFTMGPFEGALAAMWLAPKVVIPMHYNTFPVIEQDPAVFSNFVNQLHPKVDVVVMNPLEYYKPDFEKEE
jgi:hypothetical protein